VSAVLLVTLSLGPAATAEHDGGLALVEDLQAKLAVIEVSGCSKINRTRVRAAYARAIAAVVEHSDGGPATRKRASFFRYR
jgi:hypothetical protein